MVRLTSENVRRLSVAAPTFVVLSVCIVIGAPEAGSRGSVGVVMPNGVQSVTARLVLSITSRL